jgi:lipoprotein-anchoring transpeptidase ErfK/SrfK
MVVQAGKVILIERDRFRLTLWDDPEDPKEGEYDQIEKYKIAVGAKGYNTPRGVFRVVSKVKDPSWTRPASDWVPKEQWGTVVPGGDPSNPIKERWIGFSPDEGVGIHGTGDKESIGTAASHGCIRMKPKDVIDLYEQVPIGTPVVVV